MKANIFMALYNTEISLLFFKETTEKTPFWVGVSRNF